MVKAICSLIAFALNYFGKIQSSLKVNHIQSTCINLITTSIVGAKFWAAKNIDKISTFFKNNLYRSVRTKYGNLKTASGIWKYSSDTVSEKLQNKKIKAQMQPVRKAKEALGISLQPLNAVAVL